MSNDSPSGHRNWTSARRAASIMLQICGVLFILAVGVTLYGLYVVFPKRPLSSAEALTIGNILNEAYFHRFSNAPIYNGHSEQTRYVSRAVQRSLLSGRFVAS